MRVALKLWVGQVGDLWRVSVELDDVGVFDRADIGPGTAFVDAENGRQLG